MILKETGMTCLLKDIWKSAEDSAGMIDVAEEGCTNCGMCMNYMNQFNHLSFDFTAGK